MVGFAAAEVVASSLPGSGRVLAVTGPLGGPQAASVSSGASGSPMPEVASSFEKLAELMVEAAATGPSVAAALAPLVVMVGSMDALGRLSASLEGFGGLTQTRCRVCFCADQGYGIGSSPRGWVRYPSWTHIQALFLDRAIRQREGSLEGEVADL